MTLSTVCGRRTSGWALPATLVAACLLVASSAAAQPRLPQIRLSTGTFLYSPDETLVEAYLALGASSLTYRATEDGLAADVEIDVALRPAATAAPRGASSAVVDSVRIVRRYAVADTSALSDGQVFVEQVRLAGPPGEYRLAATVRGSFGAAPSSVTLLYDLTVPAYGQPGQAHVSSLQLVTSAERATSDDDPFVKNGLRLVPNPAAFYGAEQPTLAHYFEVYQPPGDSSYTLLTFLTEGAGTAPLPDSEQRQRRRSRPVDVVLAQRSVASLPSGYYYLHAAVLDEGNESVAQSSVRFYVVNPDVVRPEVVASELTDEEQVYAPMGEEELLASLEHARVIASSTEQALMQRLQTDDERRAFLVRFWEARDTDPRPGVNSARRDFYERLREVEARYGRGSRDGFRTDQGRVYLVYGRPSVVDRRDNQEGTVPHEIWEYERIPGQGRAIFVFADRFTSGQMNLIHSTATGEVTIPNWEREIRNQ